jgi:hypothetical protein
MSFKTDNWLPGAERRLLVTIALTDPDSKRESGYPSAPTLYFCNIPDPTTGAFTYSGNVYTPTILGFQGNSASVDFRGGVSDADGTLTLANVRYPFQHIHTTYGVESEQSSVKLSQLLADYVWSGATFTATAYCRIGSATETTQTVFTGSLFDVSGRPGCAPGGPFVCYQPARPMTRATVAVAAARASFASCSSCHSIPRWNRSPIFVTPLAYPRS